MLRVRAAGAGLAAPPGRALAVLGRRAGGARRLATATPLAAAPRPGPRLYVTNERSGDLSVIDLGSQKVVATVRLGKRPRGVRAEPGRHVALRRAQRIALRAARAWTRRRCPRRIVRPTASASWTCARSSW